MLSRGERKWHWRTWNLLLQIQQAADGEDRRQVSGEMTVRGLCVANTSEIRALDSRRWIEAIGSGELWDGDGNSRVVPVWAVTTDGRAALKAAVGEYGLTIQ
jgi:hypothetical protein